MNIDFGEYAILGVCNPKFAHDLINKEINAELLLPCNVVIYEMNENVFVSVVSPRTKVSLIEK